MQPSSKSLPFPSEKPCRVTEKSIPSRINRKWCWLELPVSEEQRHGQCDGTQLAKRVGGETGTTFEILVKEAGFILNKFESISKF